MTISVYTKVYNRIIIYIFTLCIDMIAFIDLVFIIANRVNYISNNAKPITVSFALFT